MHRTALASGGCHVLLSFRRDDRDLDGRHVHPDVVAVLMGAIMAFIMLSFMLSMYTSKALKAAIFAGSIIVFAGSLWLVRSQMRFRTGHSWPP